MATKQQVIPLQQQVMTLKDLRDKLHAIPIFSDKLSFLSHHPDILQVLPSLPMLKGFIDQCALPGQYVIYSVLAIGQGQIVFRVLESLENPK
jgi:hypothetical protein